MSELFKTIQCGKCGQDTIFNMGVGQYITCSHCGAAVILDSNNDTDNDSNKKGVVMKTDSNSVSQYTFSELEEMEHAQRVLARNHLRNCIAEEIAKSNQLKAEILWLQTAIKHAGRQMKIYIWPNFSPDYSDGLAFAIAKDETDARAQVVKAAGWTPGDWGQLIIRRTDHRVSYARGGGS